MKKAMSVLILLILSSVFLSTCKKEDPPKPPSLTTLAVTEILTISAKSGGNITDDGGAKIISRGIVWGLTNSPTLEQHTGLTADGSGIGIYTSSLANLTPNTTYYVRAYASNSEGIGYGSQISFTTISGGTGGFNDVFNPATNKTWMDRNLGATQVATSSTDAASYGDLYQWGRGTDGHQIRTSGTTATLSSGDTPGHGNFILAPNSPFDWRSPQNTNLWQGVNGVNNPCPSGYRLPTEAELNAERLSWSSNNSAGAFASPLKLPVAGDRHSNGSLYGVGSFGYYWSGAVDGTRSRILRFGSSVAGMGVVNRAYGVSVRCIKD